jgi:rubredoxin
MSKFHYIKVNIKGGIISPGELRYLANTAYSFGTGHIQLGERQNIYIPVSEDKKKAMANQLWIKDFDIEIDQRAYPNIVSSYVCEGLFAQTTWLSEGIYQDILSSFKRRPKLKINVVDRTQGLVPLFTGNLNFIASNYLNYWYLYINHPVYKGLQKWPVLVYSTDIANLSFEIEKILTDHGYIGVEQLCQRLGIIHKFLTKEIREELVIPNHKLPYYEGLNKAGDKYWLGIYRRFNQFPTDFLEYLCLLCSQTKVGKIYLTPWKSLIVKGIGEESGQQWEKLAGRFGINTRHSSLELNWQLADLDHKAVLLKHGLVKNFDKRDQPEKQYGFAISSRPYLHKKSNHAEIATSGLSFAVKTGPMDIAASVVIEEKPAFRIWRGISFLSTYNVLYSDDFNPNSRHYHVFASDVVKKDLPDVLASLCRLYFEQLDREEKVAMVNEPEKEEESGSLVKYLCKHCFTEYNEDYGDSVADIPAHTLFSHLPETYQCQVCEAPKSDFIQVEEKDLVLAK